MNASTNTPKPRTSAARDAAIRKAQEEDRVAAQQRAEAEAAARAERKALLVEALAEHSPLDSREVTRSGVVGIEIECSGCDFEGFDSRPWIATKQFAEHQADFILGLL